MRQNPIDVHPHFWSSPNGPGEEIRPRRASYRGTTKFSIDGGNFQQLGREYAKKNFDYVLYTFPRLFRAEDGAQKPTGPTNRDLLLQFHRQWYGQDVMTRTVANGL